MTDPIMNLDEDTINYERMMNALNGPEEVEMELAFLKRDLDALIANLSNQETAGRYAGYEDMLFSIQLSTDLIRSAAKADWPARARALADNVVDLRNYQGVR